MALILVRPLVVLDVETTGVHPQHDRIVQIGLVKVYPNGEEKEYSTLINPGVPIPPESTRVHRITDEDVAEAPTFKLVAPILAKGLQDCDVGGYNVRFDLLFLKQEFKRVGYNYPPDDLKIVDGYRIFAQHEPRNLGAAVEHYLHRKMVGAHDALVDARATKEIIFAQQEQHKLSSSVEELHRVYFQTPSEGFLDPDGKLSWRYGEATINFGTHATTPLKIMSRKYLRWMVEEGDFTPEVKRIIVEVLKGNYPVRTE